ncbi:MAG: HAD-IIB family hydrolase [Bryobacterales bacterium]|nr:HAD-IIB family hydrolase [Bryobacteraceae bacterium]MDW8355713.1 HAD-IIB family hydrolase [Bryobacterales bacterium]
MYLIFTDLDGTLLDHETYSWEPARPALERLAARRIPLILCTSKTRAEVEVYRAALGIRDPFIVENGAAVFIPRGYFPFSAPQAVARDGYEVIEFGAPYADLVVVLERAANHSGVRVRGFHEMSAEEVSERSGLRLEEARRAKQRAYDEPFVILDAGGAPRLLAEIERLGRRWTRGSRFYHLTGDNDKAGAVRCLRDLFERASGPVTTVGLGDGLNDAQFLAAVDVAILIPSPHVEALRARVPHGRLAPAPGPEGWNAALLQMIPD